MLRGESDSPEVFKIVKQMAITNRDIFVINERGDLAPSDYGKHLAWKEHYQDC